MAGVKPWGRVVLCAAYPKTGNTMIGEGIIAAGKARDATSQQEFDVYRLANRNQAPGINHALSDREPLSYLKTHALKPYRGFPHANVCDVAMCIRITRNPLDTLLSYINYTRVVTSHHPQDEIPPHVARYLANDLKLDVAQISKREWVEQSNLELLRGLGALEHALRAFSQKQLSISAVHDFAGSWSDNFLSWADPGVPLHTTTFEAFTQDKPGEVRRLAEFLGLDAQALSDAFATQQQQVKSRREGTGKAPTFFNKAKANYYAEYFERRSIVRFVEAHWPLLHACGYAAWCEQAYFSPGQ